MATIPPVEDGAHCMVEKPPYAMIGSSLQPDTVSPSASGVRVGADIGLKEERNMAAGDMLRSSVSKGAGTAGQ